MEQTAASSWLAVVTPVVAMVVATTLAVAMDVLAMLVTSMPVAGISAPGKLVGPIYAQRTLV